MSTDESTNGRPAARELRWQLVHGAGFAAAFSFAGMLASESWWEVFLFGTCIGFVIGFWIGPAVIQELFLRWWL